MKELGAKLEEEHAIQDAEEKADASGLPSSVGDTCTSKQAGSAPAGSDKVAASSEKEALHKVPSVACTIVPLNDWSTLSSATATSPIS